MRSLIYACNIPINIPRSIIIIKACPNSAKSFDYPPKALTTIFSLSFDIDIRSLTYSISSAFC